MNFLQLLPSVDENLTPFLNSLIRLSFSTDMVGLLVLVCWLTRILVFALVSMIVWSLRVIALFGEFASGVLLRHVQPSTCLVPLKYFFPTVGLGFTDCLVGFSASFNPFLAVYIDCTMELVTYTNFCSYVKCHPGFSFLLQFGFPCITSATALRISVNWAKCFNRFFLVARLVVWSPTTLPVLPVYSILLPFTLSRQNWLVTYSVMKIDQDLEVIEVSYWIHNYPGFLCRPS